MTRPNVRASAGTRNKANIVAVIGASGTGKSSYIKGELLRDFERLYAWSPLEKTDKYAEFCGGVKVEKITDLIANIKAGTRAVVYVPSGTDAARKKQFDQFCRIMWECNGATVLVEELSHVTMPSWAPPAWKQLSTGGRHQGLSIIGVSQRPANIDKDFLGNCTEVRCYRVNYENDAKTMAGALRLPKEHEINSKGQAVVKKPMDMIMDLPDFHFFHRNADRTVLRGVNKSL